MEASEPATDQTKDFEPITRPRRRVWPLVGMLILGTGIALLVLNFAKPQPTPYQFLKDAELFRKREAIYEDSPGRYEYHMSTRYTKKTSFKQFAPQMESELKADGFEVIMRTDDSLTMGTPSGENYASVSGDAREVFIHGAEYRPATPLDRLRLWFRKSFGTSDPLPQVELEDVPQGK